MDFTRTWLLGTYSKFNNPKIAASNSNKNEWTTIDAENLGSPLTISITANNFLEIKHENDIKEFINLSTNKFALSGIYKGDSLLIVQRTKDYIRKFRVRFVATKMKSGQENCASFVIDLKKFFQVVDFDSTKPEKNASDAATTSNSSFLTEKDAIQLLLEKNSHKLPLFYQQSDETDLMSSEEESVLNEFIVNCLLDARFPSFVKKVENVLNKALKD